MFNNLKTAALFLESQEREINYQNITHNSFIRHNKERTKRPVKKLLQQKYFRYLHKTKKTSL